MTGGIREGVNMEKDGDSEEDNDEEVVKQVVKRRFEGRGSSPSSFYHFPFVLSILLFISLPSCPFPHTCQLCLPALSKLEFFSLALRKIALSLKCFSHPFLLPPYPFSLHVFLVYTYICMYMVEDIIVKCGRKRVSTMMIVITKASMNME
jgi:hypothetical protein